MSYESAIKHLYFFDDLSYHIKRIAGNKGFDRQKTDNMLTVVWDYLLQAFHCIDHSNQDFVLVNWEHACSELSFSLYCNRKKFDIIVSQGCNGEYALHDLNQYHYNRFGYYLSPKLLNVRIAHILKDPGNAFYSEFVLGVSKGADLDEQCKSVAKTINESFHKNKALISLAVFDDCIQTGEGTKAVTEKILEYVEDGVKLEVNTIGFIGCESTMLKFKEYGWEIAVGTLLRGKSYPEAWEWDIYFLKDLFLDNAVRFTNNTSLPYYKSTGWFENIFPRSPQKAAECFDKIRSFLINEEIYDGLINL
jgi:hypothetical protein